MSIVAAEISVSSVLDSVGAMENAVHDDLDFGVSDADIDDESASAAAAGSDSEY